jgi:hypothetical protein
MTNNETTNETESAVSTTDAQTQTTAPAQSAPDLSIGDLKNLSIIIDVASTRGAFRANEMATVGIIYNKLQAFLARVSPAAPTTTETKPEDNKIAEATATAGK